LSLSFSFFLGEIWGEVIGEVIGEVKGLRGDARVSGVLVVVVNADVPGIEPASFLLLFCEWFSLGTARD
jgi:hypothetical protein